MRLFLTATLFLLLPFMAACTYNRGMVITPATLGPNEKVVGVVSGQSEKSYLFGGLFQWGDDSLQAALLDALSQSKTPAQGLNNVFAEKSCTFIPILPGLIWWCNTKMTGAAIQYADLGNTRIQKAPEPAAGRPDSTFGDCPQGQAFMYGQCYPLSPSFGGPK